MGERTSNRKGKALIGVLMLDSNSEDYVIAAMGEQAYNFELCMAELAAERAEPASLALLAATLARSTTLWFY